MKKLILSTVLFIGICIHCIGQKEVKGRPKLVIGIVIDQMRYDFLEEFWYDYSERGFKRLIQEGINFTQTYYSYKPTYTGPGHATIFTGKTPKEHGIVGNNWFDRSSQKVVYCATNEVEGDMIHSPARLKSSTLSDFIKKQQNNQSKSIGISLKDRGAILSAGHLANAAYWFDGEKGQFRSSEFYKGQNKTMLNSFNDPKNIDLYLSGHWKLSMETTDYEESEDDHLSYKIPFVEGEMEHFPYNLKELKKHKGFEALKGIPQGNDMLADFAKLIIQEENLGKGEFTDFLSVSFSATDYIGHQFGAQSIEVHDTYIRLDKTIGEFIDYLDKQIGRERYILFLSSDHGASMPRSYLMDKGIANGYIDQVFYKEKIDSICDAHLGNNHWIDKVMNLNVYFNKKWLTVKPEIQEKTLEEIIGWLKHQKGIKTVLNANKITTGTDSLNSMAIAGAYLSRSGELILVEEKNWTSYGDRGSTHGSPYVYDTHVPFILFGNGIKKQSVNVPLRVADIAPIVGESVSIKMDNLESRLSEFRK